MSDLEKINELIDDILTRFAVIVPFEGNFDNRCKKVEADIYKLVKELNGYGVEIERSLDEPLLLQFIVTYSDKKHLFSSGNINRLKVERLIKLYGL